MVLPKYTLSVVSQLKSLLSFISCPRKEDLQEKSLSVPQVRTLNTPGCVVGQHKQDDSKLLVSRGESGP